MSKHYELVDGKVLDYHFYQRNEDTCFFIGDKCLGTIWKMRFGWTAASLFENRYGPMNGFKTRMDAAQYLLKVFRKHREDKTCQWLPIEDAPKDGTKIVAWCNHDADLYFNEDDKTLTPYGAHVEAVGRAASDGINVVRWQDDWTILDEYSGKPIKVAGWWFLDNPSEEIPANPISYMDVGSPSHSPEILDKIFG